MLSGGIICLLPDVDNRTINSFLVLELMPTARPCSLHLAMSSGLVNLEYIVYGHAGDCLVPEIHFLSG